MDVPLLKSKSKLNVQSPGIPSIQGVPSLRSYENVRMHHVWQQQWPNYDYPARGVSTGVMKGSDFSPWLDVIFVGSCG